MIGAFLEKKIGKMAMLLNDTNPNDGYGYGYGYGVEAEKIPWYKKMLNKIFSKN
mgnify:CR=1 FL=1